MKIALLSDYSIEEYKQYGNERYWSTPKGIYDALKIDLRIDEIRWYPTPSNDKSFGFVELKSQYESKEFVPDVILWMSCGPSEGDKLFSKENYPKSKLVVECGDEPQTFYYNQERTKNADLILTPDFECHLMYKSMGYSSIFTSHWTDTNIFYPSLTKYQPFDVVTSMYGNRGDIVLFLQSNLKNLSICISFYLRITKYPLYEPF